MRFAEKTGSQSMQVAHIRFNEYILNSSLYFIGFSYINICMYIHISISYIGISRAQRVTTMHICQYSLYPRPNHIKSVNVLYLLEVCTLGKSLSVSLFLLLYFFLSHSLVLSLFWSLIVCMRSMKEWKKKKFNEHEKLKLLFESMT